MSGYDYSPIVQALIGLAAGAITILSGFALRCLQEWLEGTRVARVLRAAGNGAELALAHIEAAGFGAQIDAAEAAGLKIAETYIKGGTVGRLITSIGYTDEHVMDMLKAQLNRLRRERAAGRAVTPLTSPAGLNLAPVS